MDYGKRYSTPNRDFGGTLVKLIYLGMRQDGGKTSIRREVMLNKVIGLKSV